jgi:hypothetical protein
MRLKWPERGSDAHFQLAPRLRKCRVVTPPFFDFEKACDTTRPYGNLRSLRLRYFRGPLPLILKSVLLDCHFHLLSRQYLFCSLSIRNWFATRNSSKYDTVRGRSISSCIPARSWITVKTVRFTRLRGLYPHPKIVS